MNAYIKALVRYALNCNLIEESDRVYAVNSLLALLDEDSFDDSVPAFCGSLEEILNALCDEAVKKGLIEDNVTARDLFDTSLMGALTPRPSYVINKFNELYAENPQKATDFYYKFSCDTDYIRRYRIARDKKWKYKSDFGELDITINLSKPEKDPKAIAAAKNAIQSGYPLCQLCKESEGYRGRMNFPARQSHRIIPVELSGEKFFMQYSPYVYYNEHCIVLNSEHIPMVINKAAFSKLLSFVERFPHYFVGSNADLPIVGGSILSHEHFQGGHYEFPMAKAEIERELSFKGFEQVEAGIVKWPMSVIRLRSEFKDKLSELAEKILLCWRGYSDEDSFIFSETDGEMHNTITPIARKRGDKFELDLVLRNNITTKEYPLGVYHPHSELHHIKKENIGLIEVMGLAVLPARLDKEMKILADYIVNCKEIRTNPDIEKHADWAENIIKEYENINNENVNAILEKEIGKVFAQVLCHAGVYKRDEKGMAAFFKFIDSVNG